MAKVQRKDLTVATDLARMNTGNVTDLVVANDFAVMDGDIEDYKENIQDNLAGFKLRVQDLPRITVPTGGSTTWLMIDEDGERETKFIDAIVAHIAVRRFYWEISYADNKGEKTPPNCMSMDGVFGTGAPTAHPDYREDNDIATTEYACYECPYSKFGADGTPPKCQERRLMFFFEKDDVMPKLVSVPPASLRPLRDFLKILSTKGNSYKKIIVRMSLERAKSANNIDHAQMRFKRVGRLTREEVARIKEYTAAMMSLFQSVQGIEIE